MVLTDRDMDELWRKAGTYGGKIKESLEVAEENERSSFSQVTTKLFNEYRDIKADFEKANEAYIKLREEYQKRIDEIIEWRRKYDELNKEAARMQQQLMRK